MNTVCIKALRPGVALPSAARYFEKRHFSFNEFRPGVALPPAAQHFEKRHLFQCIPEAGGRLVPGGLEGGAPQRMCLR